MAKLSQTLRDNKRVRMMKKFAGRRAELRSKLQDPNASLEEKFAAQEGFAKLPRNSCKTRQSRRCRITGRSHAVYRKFGISRIMLREMALKGELPGVRKASW
jgi:small subunit ribosomal protein S14